MTTSQNAFLAIVAAGCIAAAGIGAFVGVRTLTPEPTMAEGAPAPSGAIQHQTTAVGTRDIELRHDAEARADASRPATVHASSALIPAKPSPPSSPIAVVAQSAAADDPTSENESLPASSTVATPVPTDIAVTAPAPRVPEWDDLTIEKASVIGIRLDGTISSETARLEDRVTAHVTRDVNVDGRTAIPAGSRIEGWVTSVTRGGKFKEQARIGIRFTSLILAHDVRVPIQTETIFREGDAPTGEAASKIGASAVVGAILGSVIGGKKGAAVGGAAGAAGGTAVVMAQEGNPAVLANGSALTVRLSSPVVVTVDRDTAR